jgi:hypothetical protein
MTAGYRPRSPRELFFQVKFLRLVILTGTRSYVGLQRVVQMNCMHACTGYDVTTDAADAV